MYGQNKSGIFFQNYNLEKKNPRCEGQDKTDIITFIARGGSIFGSGQSVSWAAMAAN